MAKKVFIGVGHGGKDSGATGNGFKEKDLNLSIALACRDELVKNGVSVQMSRTRDENDPLVDEIKECNRFNPDLALDIHNNSGGGDGAEVFHYSKGGTSKILAQNILNEIVKIGQNSRGLKTKLNSKGTDYFGFIREIKAPSVIVECAFIDNKNDIKIIDTEAERKKMGVAIAHGILKTLGIAIKATPTPKPTPNKVDIIYQTWDDVTNKWLPNVKNNSDYAGIYKHDICCVYANLSKGDCWYRVHTKGGKWLPEVKNRSDYAGIYNKPIDGFMIKTNTGKKIMYQAHLRRLNKWLPIVSGYNTASENGYAGVIGQEIDAIKIWLS